VPVRRADEQDEPALPLDEGGDGAGPGAEDQVPFPVPGHRPVIGLGGALGDADGVPEAALAVLGGQCLRAAPGAAGAQAAGQLRAQRAPGLHEQRQVEGLAGHAHLRIIAIARRQPARDLLR